MAPAGATLRRLPSHTFLCEAPGLTPTEAALHLADGLSAAGRAARCFGARGAVAFLETAIAWFGAHGVVVQRVMTDNGSCQIPRIVTDPQDLA